jgi:predicted kinase
LREPFVSFVETKLGSGFVLIACGLPGTWKTETTEEVARIKCYPLLRSDLIRLEVLKNEDVFDAKVAADMTKRTSVYDEMFKRAEQALVKDSGVILDATFVTQSLRRQAAGIATRYNLKFIILQTDCPQEVSIRRILNRTKEAYESNALTEEAYLNNKKRFEAVDLDDLKRTYPALSILHLIVDTQYDPPQDWRVIDLQQR